jgi:threonine/homoserine/homoserine lactone efflux protein
VEVVRELPTFVLAVILLAAVPGPAVAVLIRRAAIGGLPEATPLVLGLESGLYVWIIAAGAGLAALVATSHVAYDVLRVVGAVLLVALGVQAWRAAARHRETDDPPGVVDLAVLPATRLRPRGRWGGYVLGLVTNLANPKAAVFVFAFYPQFLPDGYPLLPTAAGLGLVQVSVETVLYLAVAALVSRASAWFATSRVRRSLDAISGAVLIGLGLRVAIESN